jgi:hypothetical protein
MLLATDPVMQLPIQAYISLQDVLSLTFPPAELIASTCSADHIFHCHPSAKLYGSIFILRFSKT